MSNPAVSEFRKDNIESDPQVLMNNDANPFAKLIKNMANKEGKSAVVFGTVTDNERIYVVPKLTVDMSVEVQHQVPMSIVLGP